MTDFSEYMELNNKISKEYLDGPEDAPQRDAKKINWGDKELLNKAYGPIGDRPNVDNMTRDEYIEFMEESAVLP